jgi:hypothetical protein
MIKDYAYVDVRVINRGDHGSDSFTKRLRYLDPYDDLFGFEQQLPESPSTAVEGDEYE